MCGSGTGDTWAGDLRLTTAAAAGEPTARRLMAQRLLERVRTTVRYLSGDHRDQDDFVQLSLLEILRSAANYAGKSSLEAWSDRITLRTTMRLIRRGRARDDRISFSEPEAPAPDGWTGGDHGRLAMRRHLARQLGRLSPERRSALVLRLVHGYAVEEIAELTGAPHNTVRDRLARGRRQLRLMLEKDPAFAAWVTRESHD